MQVLRVDGMEAYAEERDREVQNILQSINDLGQIMKDLSVLVIDQGTILDRIDYNMDQVRLASLLVSIMENLCLMVKVLVSSHGIFNMCDTSDKA